MKIDMALSENVVSDNFRMVERGQRFFGFLFVFLQNVK